MKIRKLAVSVFILMQVVIRTLGEGAAQNAYYKADGLMLGGYMVTAIGNDSTMAGATNQNLCSARTVYKFVKDSAPAYARNAMSITTSGSGNATYTSATGVFNIPTFAQYVPTVYNNVVRTLSSNYIISSTLIVAFVYSIQINVTLALAARTGTITVQTSTNGGSSWVSLPYVAFTPALAGIGLVSNQIVQINGTAPPGALVRIIPTTVTGVSYTYIDGQEVY